MKGKTEKIAPRVGLCALVWRFLGQLRPLVALARNDYFSFPVSQWQFPRPLSLSSEMVREMKREMKGRLLNDFPHDLFSTSLKIRENNVKNSVEGDGAATFIVTHI
jgi:hypothetical protein